jgi:cell division septum initiation protein DivIVA
MMSDLFEILEEENDDLRRRIKKLEEFVDHVATFKYIDAALGIQTLIDDAVDWRL